jgi:hypothetical protein
MDVRRTTLVGIATLGLIIGGGSATALASTPAPTHTVLAPSDGGDGGKGGSGRSHCGSSVAISNSGGGRVKQCTGTGGKGGDGGSDGGQGGRGGAGTSRHGKHGHDG